MNTMNDAMSNWLSKRMSPKTKEWMRPCEMMTDDTGVRSVCLEFANKYEAGEIPIEEFLASLSNITGKTLEEISEILEKVAKEDKQPDTTLVEQEPVELKSGKMITLVNSELSPDQIKIITRMFFPTKKETAEHYPVYLYLSDLNTWLAPRNPSGVTKEVMDKIIGIITKSVAYTEPTQIRSGMDAVDMTPSYMSKYIGSYIPYSIKLQGKTNIPGSIRYSISDQFLLITDIHTYDSSGALRVNPMYTVSALIYVVKQANGRRIITTALKNPGLRMLTNMQERGYIKILPLPPELVEASRKESASMGLDVLNDPVEVKIINLPEV